MKRKLFAFLVIFGLIQSNFCWPAEKGKQTISLDFPETSLSAVLDVLSLKTGRKFITDSELARKKIILNLKEVTAEEALNALLDTYDLYYIRQGETNIYVIKSKAEGTVSTVSKVLFCNYSSAKEMADVLKPKLTRGGNISFDERTNTLVVTDMSDNIEKIESLMKTIDIPTMQVLLEAKIIDVKMDSSLNVGVDFSNISRDIYYQSPLDVVRKYGQTSNTSQIYPIDSYKLLAENIKSQTAYGQAFAPQLQTSSKLSVSVLGNGYNIDGMIEAMKKDTNAKLLTSPKLLVLNNQDADINIVEEIPYEERTQNNTGQMTISTQFKEVGIKLKVKPQISRDGTITLNVVPEQSFRTGESISNVPVISTSKANTTFMLKNGETAVIGGLIRETDSKTEYKVPLLGDIPIIGMLFKKLSKEKVRTELTIFITAKIIQ